MSHVFQRNPGVSLPVAVKGEGCYIIDSDGKQYLDACGGAAVSCLGHNDPVVLEAIKSQIDSIAFAHTSFFGSEPAELLAAKLAENAPGDLDRVYFLSGGSEAVEAALKLARQYFVEIGQPQRKHIISRRQSYHGNTLGALSAGGNQWRRAPFEPLLVEMSHIAPCYAYRGLREEESEFDYGQRVAGELEQKIVELGPENVASFIAEPVVGATLGAVPPVAGYFEKIREICNRYGVLLILDEVMCGMGRTGTLFAYEQENIVPDIVTIAKGLGAGYQPIGAMMCTDKIYQVIVQGSGFFQHGHTYVGHPTVCAAALAVMNRLVDDEIVDGVSEKGGELMNLLDEAFAQHPHIGDIRGRGLFAGLEIVENRGTKKPFDPVLKIHAKIKSCAQSHGLLCYPMGGTLDGKQGDHILLAPPYIIEKNQMKEAVDKLSQAIETVMSQVQQ